MKLETKNLKVISLNLKQFSLLLQGVNKMENELNLVHSNYTLDKDTQIAMEWLYENAIKNTKSDNLWYTNWQFVLKAENKSIGSACFIPTKYDDVIEIGYGINSDYRNKGFATEAIRRMCNLALNQPQIKMIIAETDINNYPSHKVLEKCGMVRYKKTNCSIFWKLTLL